MSTISAIAIDRATSSDVTLLANLLELYIHDLSSVFPNIEPGPDGRFGYAKLSQYFSEPERRQAFLFRSGARIAGFALVSRGSPASSDPEVLDVAEFFVLRRHRRAGVGRQAAALLWQQLPGTWTVRVSEGNPAGLSFWSRAIQEFTNGNATVATLAGDPHAWRVFSFDTALAR